jgi:SAM-dependent methyltransferase
MGASRSFSSILPKEHDMSAPTAWYSEDAFWRLFEPVLFSPQRVAHAVEEVDRLDRLLSIGPGASILDLCCGTGRHSLELARRGCHVTGVDRTPAYIEKARAAAAQEGLAAAFAVADMRDYCEPDRYDVIVNLFGSFGYFEDPENDRRVVANAYASLRPGGRFLIETMGKEILARGFQAHDWEEREDGLLLLSEKRITHNWSRVETRWIAIRGTERAEYRVAIRSYSAVELSSLLSQCGFTELQVYGSLDGIEYNEHAQRLVVIGRKPDGD